MKLTPGKLGGLKKVSDERGVIAAAAIDQRGSLQKSLAKEKGADITDAMMQEFKSLVTEVLLTTPVPSCSIPSGACPPPSAAPTMPVCCSPMRKRDTTRPVLAACPTCSISGLHAA